MSLPDWVKQTCELYGLSYDDAIVSKFTDNGEPRLPVTLVSVRRTDPISPTAITLNMLPSLVDADWKELIPQVCAEPMCLFLCVARIC